MVDAVSVEPRSATITTQEPSEVLTVSRDHFLHIIEKSPKILLKMAAVRSKRLRKTNELIHSLAFFDVYGKVARTLLGDFETIHLQFRISAVMRMSNRKIRKRHDSGPDGNEKSFFGEDS